MSDTTSYPVPEINFDSGVLTQDLLRWHFAFLQGLMRDQTSIIGGGGYGIVDTEDPTTALADTNIRPFQVAATADSTKYTVTPGICVTPVGDIATVSAGTTVSLASQTQGVFNCICVRYQIKDSGIYGVSTTGHVASAGTVGVVDVICITEAAYKALATTDQNRLVVIGGVYVDASTSVQTIVFDDSSRAWLRPWFTAADTKHRSMIGSGTVSDTNPHGTGLADIGVGSMRVFDLLTSTGMVVSPDKSIKGVPGTYCNDIFTPAEVLVDTDGSITGDSFFGGTGMPYVRLSVVPNTITGARDSINNYPVAVDWIAGTDIVVLYRQTVPQSASITVSYTKTTSLAVSAKTAATISLSGINSSDVVVSNGAAVTTILQNSVAFRKFGLIPRTFQIFCTDTGYIVTDPMVVAPAFNVLAYLKTSDTVNANMLTGTWTPRTRSRVGIGGHDLGTAEDMSVTVSITGINATSSATVTELITLNQTNYEDAAYPPNSREFDKQVHYTNTVFSAITVIAVVAQNNVSRTGTVTIYGKFDPAGHRYAKICSGLWTGRSLTSVVDQRRILTTVRDGFFGQTDITATAEVLVAANEVAVGTAPADSSSYRRVGLICSEDFREPRFIDGDSTLWDGTVDSGKLIPTAVVDSDSYRGVYRSRMLPIRKYESELCGFIVFLHSADVSTVSEYGAVRILLQRNSTGTVQDANGASRTATIVTYGEMILKQMRDDLSGQTFIGYTNQNYSSCAVVVSGKCKAVSVYFSNASNVDTSYIVTPTIKASSVIL